RAIVATGTERWYKPRRDTNLRGGLEMKTNEEEDRLDLNEIRARLEQRRSALRQRVDQWAVAELRGGPAPGERNDVNDVGDDSVADAAEDGRLSDAERAGRELRLVEEAI